MYRIRCLFLKSASFTERVGTFQAAASVLALVGGSRVSLCEVRTASQFAVAVTLVDMSLLTFKARYFGVSFLRCRA